mgnify:CR=1 FL=1
MRSWLCRLARLPLVMFVLTVPAWAGVNLPNPVLFVTQVPRQLEALEGDRRLKRIVVGPVHHTEPPLGHDGFDPVRPGLRRADDAEVIVGHMAGTLFVARQNDLDIFLLMQHVEDLQHHAPGQGEDRLDPFLLEALDEDFGSGQFHIANLLPGLPRLSSGNGNDGVSQMKLDRPFPAPFKTSEISKGKDHGSYHRSRATVNSVG